MPDRVTSSLLCRRPRSGSASAVEGFLEQDKRII